MASYSPTLAAFILLSMTLKNAALLALVGTILMTILLVWDFVSNVLNVLMFSVACRLRWCSSPHSSMRSVA
jgi:hypothetical protein